MNNPKQKLLLQISRMPFQRLQLHTLHATEKDNSNKGNEDMNFLSIIMICVKHVSFQ